VEWRKILVLVWRLRKSCECCAVDVREFSNQELNVTHVDVGSTIAVVMLKLEWQRAENGSVTSVDRRGSDW
jgi:hypothetical protein